jgi:hypothetical protein
VADAERDANDEVGELAPAAAFSAYRDEAHPRFAALARRHRSRSHVPAEQDVGEPTFDVGERPDDVPRAEQQGDPEQGHHDEAD